MAFSCKQMHAAPTVARPNSKRACTVVASALPKTGTSKASLAAAGAALLLVRLPYILDSLSPQLSDQDSQPRQFTQHVQVPRLHPL
jgi:LPXTG-motif cell wall-anchored protein